MLGQRIGVHGSHGRRLRRGVIVWYAIAGCRGSVNKPLDSGVTGSFQNGYRAVVCFVVQRSDADYFSPAIDIDPVFAKTLKNASDKGVEILVYQAEVTKESIEIANKLPVLL